MPEDGQIVKSFASLLVYYKVENFNKCVYVRRKNIFTKIDSRARFLASHDTQDSLRAAKGMIIVINKSMMLCYLLLLLLFFVA